MGFSGGVWSRRLRCRRGLGIELFFFPIVLRTVLGFDELMFIFSSYNSLLFFYLL